MVIFFLNKKYKYYKFFKTSAIQTKKTKVLRHLRFGFCVIKLDQWNNYKDCLKISWGKVGGGGVIACGTQLLMHLMLGGLVYETLGD